MLYVSMLEISTYIDIGELACAYTIVYRYHEYHPVEEY